MNKILEKLLDGADVKWVRLGDVCKFTYGYVAKAQPIGDFRFVRITDIDKNGKLLPDNQMFVDLSDKNKKYILNKNDLLVARTGAA
jgi:type I restriction enzyme S subunit